MFFLHCRSVQRIKHETTVHSLGDPVESWTSENQRKVTVKSTRQFEAQKHGVYGFDLPSKKDKILHDVCLELEDRLCKRLDKVKTESDVPYYTDVRIKSQAVFRTSGRIASDREGKLDRNAIYLEGSPSEDESAGKY